MVELRVPGRAQGQRLYGKSYALVIGASKYTRGWKPLKGVPGDVTAVSALLARQGFEVDVLSDPTYQQLEAGLREFIARRGGASENRLLVYFAGHGHSQTKDGTGIQLGYLVPVDAPSPVSDPDGFERLAYSMDNIDVLARRANAKHVLFLFDSCFSGSIFDNRDAGTPEHISDLTSRPVRQFITAGDARQAVPDASIFRERLERALGEGAADLDGDGYITGTELGAYLHKEVSRESRQSQTPQWGKIRDGRLDRGDFVFVSPRGVPPPPPPPPPLLVGPREADAWSLCQAARTAGPCKTYLSLFGNGPNAVLARARVDDLEAPEARPVQGRLTRPPASLAVGQTETFTVTGVSFKMVWIPAGSFLMGSPASELERSSDEEQHRVSVKAFQLGQTEVTQGLWQAVMGSNPSHFKDCGANCPVEQVSWEDAQAFIRKLNDQTGQKFRLPNEAEWEYAARAGTTTAFSTGETITSEQANFDGNYSYNGSARGVFRGKTTPAGNFQTNSFGLHDMHGNVWEWVQDCYVAYSEAPTDGSAVNPVSCTRRVLRGGSWGYGPRGLRSADRDRNSPDVRNSYSGFRLARTVF